MAARKPAPDAILKPPSQPTRYGLLAAASALMIDGDTIEISFNELAQERGSIPRWSNIISAINNG